MTYAEFKSDHDYLVTELIFTSDKKKIDRLLGLRIGERGASGWAGGFGGQAGRHVLQFLIALIRAKCRTSWPPPFFWITFLVSQERPARIDDPPA